MVMLIEVIKELWGITSGSITLGDDRINALYEALDYEYRPTSGNQQQFNLLSGTQAYLKMSEIEYISKHVKGHHGDRNRL